MLPLVPAFFLSIIKYRSTINPILIISFWWLGWFTVSSLGLTVFHTPGPKTLLIIYISVFSFILGAFLAPKKQLSQSFVYASNERLIKNWLIFSKILLITAPIFLLLLGIILEDIIQEGLLNYMRKIRRNEEYTNISLFGYKIENLIQYLLLPLIYAGLISGTVLCLKGRSNFLLLLSTFFITVYSLATFGRIHLYAFLFFVAIALAHNKLKHKKQYQTVSRRQDNKERNLVVVGFLFILIVLTISVFRRQGILDIERLFTRYIIEYHTMGFVLLDQQLIDKTSWMSQKLTLGRSILDGLLFYVELFLRLLGFDLESIKFIRADNSSKSERILIGESKSNINIYGQAFYTGLSTLFLDFKWAGVSFFSFVYGYFISKTYMTWLNFKNLESFILLIFLYYIGLFSIFKSPIEGPNGLPLLILIYCINKLKTR